MRSAPPLNLCLQGDFLALTVAFCVCPHAQEYKHSKVQVSEHKNIGLISMGRGFTYKNFGLPRYTGWDNFPQEVEVARAKTKVELPEFEQGVKEALAP